MDKIVDEAVKWLEEFISLTGLKFKVGSNKVDDARWIPPDKGKFLINVDAATNIRTGDRGLGIITRDSAKDVFFVPRPFTDPFLSPLKLLRL